MKVNFISYIFFIFFSVFLQRLLLLNNFPSSDDGFYIFFSSILFHEISSGNLPNYGSIGIYQLFLSWISFFDFNPFILYRFADLLVASYAIFLLFKIVSIECIYAPKRIAVLIAFLISLSLNHPDYIQHGYKNSYFFSYIFLFSAYLIYLKNYKLSKYFYWFWIGVLISIGVLVRETFLFVPLIASPFIFFRYGIRALIFYFLGGILIAFIILTTIAILRGGFFNIFETYVNLGSIYGHLNSIHNNFFKHLNQFLKTELLICFIFLLSLIYLFYIRFNIFNSRIFYWLLFIIFSFIEPIVKFSVPYHLSVSLIGMGMIISISVNSYFQSSHSKNKKLPINFLIFPFLFFLVFLSFCKNLTVTLEKKQNGYFNFHNNGYWSDYEIYKSNWTTIAKAINNISNSDSSLAVTGGMHGLFPLTNLNPISFEMADISYFYLMNDKNIESLRLKILSCPPDIIFNVNKKGYNDIYNTFNNLIMDLNIYDLEEFVPKSKKNDYGSFFGNVYKIKEKNYCYS